MNVIFITLSNINEVRERGIYADLMRKFRDKGHGVYIVSPCERRMGQRTHVIETNGVKILKVRTLNIQKTNLAEKGVGTLLIEKQFKLAICKYLGDVRFDLILYSTPPITFTNVVRYLKRQNPDAVSYLLLKDIFPQNAVDIGMLKKETVPHKPTHRGDGLLKGVVKAVTGLPKCMLYRFFRKKEVALYKASDYIGCMSPANVEFVIRHNDFIDPKRVEVAPNSVELEDGLLRENLADDEQAKAERRDIRTKYGLPVDKPIFIYGGNLGKPQDIPFLIDCLETNRYRTDCYFLVVGTGTEYDHLKSWMDEVERKGENVCVKVMKGLPKQDYDLLVRSCDVGMIFLDHRFTIPNYPSRLLSYLEYRMPVICCTDPNTDIGRIAEENGYGYWCESVKPADFTALVDKMLRSDRKAMGERGFEFLKKNYTVQNTYDVIVKHLGG